MREGPGQLATHVRVARRADDGARAATTVHRHLADVGELEGLGRGQRRRVGLDDERLGRLGGLTRTQHRLRVVARRGRPGARLRAAVVEVAVVPPPGLAGRLGIDGGLLGARLRRALLPDRLLTRRSRLLRRLGRAGRGLLRRLGRARFGLLRRTGLRSGALLGRGGPRERVIGRRRPVGVSGASALPLDQRLATLLGRAFTRLRTPPSSSEQAHRP
ncbi:MAG: hypothetical protein PGN13_07765 [Patulibacter minatonensis]